MVKIRSGETPKLTRNSLAASARRSPRPKLYSSLPRSSQWPSTVKWMLGWALKKVTSVAFVVLQASVADCPLSIVAGLTDSVTSGFGGGAGAAGAGGGVVSTAGALTSFLWHPPNVRAKHPRTEEIIRLRLRMNILMP